MKIVKGLFGIKYMYLDNKTRVRYGYNFSSLGISYTLERKKLFWRETAWTYAKTHERDDMQEILEYLKWYEKDKERERTVSKCKF